MSNFANQQEAKKEQRERDRSTKETIAKYFLDLSKLIFTAIVLGGLAPIFTDNSIPINWVIVFLGMISTVCMALIGYKLLKSK